MTDGEMTKLCALAMGVEWEHLIPRSTYHPLTDDAQAMALVKKFHLMIRPPDGVEDYEWSAIDLNGDGISSKDLSRAIVECVARSVAIRTTTA